MFADFLILLVVKSGMNSGDSGSIKDDSTNIGIKNVNINNKLKGIKLLKSDCGILYKIN